jgi:type IV pilus assembly protein PilA
MKNDKGFTLIEFIIVILIITILSVLAIPILQGFIKKAVMTEAITALGAIKNLQKQYYVEHGEYASVSDITDLPGISAGDLNGTYFSEGCYSTSPLGPNFEIRCNTLIPGGNQAPQAAYAGRALAPHTQITMDHSGTVKVF